MTSYQHSFVVNTTILSSFKPNTWSLIKFFVYFLFCHHHPSIHPLVECRELGWGATATYSLYRQICLRWINKRRLDTSGFHNSYSSICNHSYLLPARSLSQSFSIQKTYWTWNGWRYYLVKGTGNKNAWITRCSWTTVCL